MPGVDMFLMDFPEREAALRKETNASSNLLHEAWSGPMCLSAGLFPLFQFSPSPLRHFPFPRRRRNVSKSSPSYFQAEKTIEYESKQTFLQLLLNLIQT